MSRQTRPLRTYSHLEKNRKVPSEYEIATSRLLYYVERGFEVDVPVGPFYARHQRGCPLRSPDWEAFADPRETTYPLYTDLQAQKEIHLDALLHSADTEGHAARLDETWRSRLVGVLGPARFAWHGLQMISAYLGHVAPSGRLTLVAMFQAADQMRVVHGLSRWLAQFDPEPSAAPAALSAAARTSWQDDPAWQPLRRAVELALVAYDWGESFVALNLCLKPWMDALLFGELSVLARERGDFFSAEILKSFESDSRWHQEWAAALVDHLRQTGRDNLGPDNLEYLQRKMTHWRPLAEAAAAGVASTFGERQDAACAAVAQTVENWEKTRLGMRFS